MKQVFILLMGLVLISATIRQDKVKIYMVGDSTMANKAANKYPETGWGQVFNQLFNENVVIENKAINGRSSRSFIEEGRWQQMLDRLQPGNYVFIEFGHNDEKVQNAKKGTTLEQFKEFLTRYVTETRAKQGIPILLTPVERRIFKGGQLYDSHAGYPEVVRQVAAEHKVPLIDLHLKSRAYLNEVGIQPSKKLFLHVDSGVTANYPKGIADNTHFSEEGAKAMAGLAAQGLRELDLPLKNYLK